MFLLSAGWTNDTQIQRTQNQVDEVVGIMKDNVEKVLERDAKLTDLEDKSETLRDGAQRFQKTSTQVKKKMWWKNLKWTLIMVAVALVIALIIILITKPWT
eukprot:Ihof_evm9s231 gene=Ihof_evmTU9s231